MADRRPAWALAAVIVRYLTTIQPHAHRELARWRRRALVIPDPDIRTHVLHPYEADESVLGATLFAVLAPWRQQQSLVRLLVAYVLLWSYVDVRTERAPNADPRLYGALLDGLREEAAACPLAAADDAGYLAALLAACRRGCATLPSWETVAPVAVRLACDGRAVQALNHGPPAAVPTRLRKWARQHAGDPWHEACAAASSPLVIHALMALAAGSSVRVDDVETTAIAYGPVSALGVFFDHLLDDVEDRVTAAHTYLPYLGSPAERTHALRDLADRAASGVRGLPVGERHVVILAAMAAMFLSRREGATPEEKAVAVAIVEAIGTPAPLLLTVLAARRRIAASLTPAHLAPGGGPRRAAPTGGS